MTNSNCSSPSSSLSSSSSSINLTQPITQLTPEEEEQQTAAEQPIWNHDHNIEIEDEDDDRLWHINTQHPQSLQRTHLIPSITLIDPQTQLRTTNNNNNNNPQSTSSLNNQPPPPPPHLSVAHHLPTPNEEWRSKILNSVRKGEEKVAQRRKQSLASLDTSNHHQSNLTKEQDPNLNNNHPKGKQPATISSIPKSFDDHSNNLSTNNPYLELLNSDLNPTQHTSKSSPTNHQKNTTPTPEQPTIPSSNYAPVNPNTSPRPSGTPRTHTHVRCSSNSITEGPSRPLIPTSLLSRSNSTTGRAHRLNSDDRASPSRNIPTDSSTENLIINPEPPPPVDGTFLTVVEPDLSLRLGAGIPSSDSASPDPSRPGSNFNTSPNPNPDLFSAATANTRNTSTTRSKTGKRNFFSTLLHRASGSNSSLTSPASSSAPTPTVRNPFESTFIRPSDSTLRGQLNRPGPESHGSSNQALDPDSIDQAATAGIHSSYATASTLASMNLKLTPLTPTLPASRSSQPLCGAILDDKFLLIGTNSGLDFVPLTPFTKASNASDRFRGSVRTVKPISLIKKTRFKSLKVLEVRSNILLAIAGRNDHLRVYALDGIRAIIAKKIQDLEEKEDFVWLPKSLARATPHKGKERVSNAQAQPTVTNSPQYSPPPPYGGKLGPSQSMTKSNSFQPTTAVNEPIEVPRSTVKSNLRRSSTVGSRLPSSSSAFRLTDTRRSSLHSASDSSSFISPLGLAGSSLTAALQSLRTAGDSDQIPAALGRGPLQVGLEHEIEENYSLQPESRPLIHNGDELARGSNVQPVVANNGQAAETGTALVEVIKNRSQLLVQAGKRISNPTLPIQPIPSSRMVPRSALATDTDNESMYGSQVNLVDVLSQNSGALPINASGLSSRSRTSMGEASSLFSTKKTTAEPKSVPGPPPLITTSTSDVHPQINITDEITEVQPTPSAGSTSLVRPGLNPVADESQRPVSGMTSHSSPSPLPHRASSRVPSTVVHSDQENQPSSLTVPSRSKKRWSVMDSVFRTHSSSSNSHANNHLTSTSTSAALPSRSSTDESLVRSASCNHISGMPIADAANGQHTPTLRSRLSMQKLRINVSESNGEFGAIGASSLSMGGASAPAGASAAGAVGGGVPGSQSEFQDQPRERLATHLHGQSAAESAKTSPHPATLGAPLEYVKLARTKRAKLLRAYETRRRTYLAVLCGEASERIELFTGSKNISLSLNRTFVLPETPRTIEFQMQGDDLVDIYLVYDESVFALEPATVRVREVGIGRNERRAARRERERAARDLASINMRPSVTAGGSHSSAGVNPAGGYMTDPTESMIQAVGLPAQATVSSSPSTTVDDGLTLSAPVPPSSFRHASAANAASIVTGWGTHDGGTGNPSGPAKVPNLWPYTTFQQLQFIPPLPPSVLASTFVIPPTYEAVVMASGGPRAVQNSLAPPDEDPARSLLPINVVEPELGDHTIPLNLAVDRLRINNGSSSIVGEAGSEAGSSIGIGNSTGSARASNLNLADGSEAEMDFSSDIGEATLTNDTVRESQMISPRPQTILADGPLLSPISLLSNPASRQIGPPGLFLVTRGKKVTSIVDCDGRSVMKKPFIWMNDKKSRPSTNGAENGQLAGGFRIEVVLIDERRTVLVGLDHLEVKLFEVGGRQAKGLEEFSNSATLDIFPQLILGATGGPTNQVTAVGGGNGVGVITAKSFSSSPSLSYREHHHSTLNLSSLTNLTIGLSKWNDSPSSSNYHHHHSNNNSGGGGGGNGSNISLPGSAAPGSSQLSATPNHGANGIPLPPTDREVIFLGSSIPRNAVIWAERIGNSFAIYSLSSASNPPPLHLPSHPSSSSPFAPPTSPSLAILPPPASSAP